MKVSPVIHGAGTGVCIIAACFAPNLSLSVWWGVVGAAMFADGLRALIREFPA